MSKGSDHTYAGWGGGTESRRWCAKGKREGGWGHASVRNREVLLQVPAFEEGVGQMRRGPALSLYTYVDIFGR